MKVKKIFYASMFLYGGNPAICDKHSTLKRALRAARRCEKRGGAPHFFWKIETLQAK